MLLRFEASNYRSILEPVELSMIAVDEDRPSARGFDLLSGRVLSIAGIDRPSARGFDLLSGRVLSIAGIYGPNASGKSNVVEALAWLSTAVGRSLRAWDEFIPREPFKFGRGPEMPSTYEVEMVVEGVRYAYHLDVNDSAVLYEGLYSYPERRRRVLFERDGLEIHFRRGLGSIAGTRELLTPTTLALSAAMRFDEPEVQPFGRYLASIRVLGVRRRAAWRGPLGVGAQGISSTERLFDERRSSTQPTLFDDFELASSNPRESALALLRFADLGIDDVQIIEDEDDDTRVSTPGRREPRRQLRLMHRVAEQELPFDFAEESAGTQTWFALI